MRLLTAMAITFAFLLALGSSDSESSKPTEVEPSDEKTEAKSEQQEVVITEQKEVEKEIKSKEPAVEEIIKVTSAEMLLDYSENVVRAEKNYNGKLVEVTGEVGNIGKRYITLVSGEPFAIISVQCQISSDNREAIAYVDSGQTIRVQGTVSGKFGNILIKNCKIMD